MPGIWVAKTWWEKKGLDLVEAQVATEAVEEEGGTEETDGEADLVAGD